MLTKLKVSGFKNLVDAEIQFGPFTCIAGPNAAGKSNLFDAINFLSHLADHTLLDAALSVRVESGVSSDIRSLFHRIGDKYDDTITLEAEMIVPGEGVDDLGQTAHATITFLRYRLEIGYNHDSNLPSLGSLKLNREELEHLKLSDAARLLRFPHRPAWRKSVIRGRRTAPFISTIVDDSGNKIIKLNQDGSGGRPKAILATNLPRTVLSTVNATESPTALLARREMQAWRTLQLEPSSLREPDRFTTPPGLGQDGSHLPATLNYLAHSGRIPDLTKEEGVAFVYGQVSSRLGELINDVREVGIDRDEKRELLTLQVTERDGTIYPARSLSDGTLRFLALTVIDLDPNATGVICLEEPENGIHPQRIPAMLRLLKSIACDAERPVDMDNPLRQVIVNTHSPAVVAQINDDSLLIAETREAVKAGVRFKGVQFTWLPNTWRANIDQQTRPIARGDLLAYLNPVLPEETEQSPSQRKNGVQKQTRRVIDNFQMSFPFYWQTHD